METKYLAYVWPDYQVFMGEDWFREESYFDPTNDTYLIPEDRVYNFYALKYRVGDKVTIKSLDWYNQNKDENGEISLENGDISFVLEMSEYCGKTATIVDITEDNDYILDIDEGEFAWCNEMFEE